MAIATTRPVTGEILARAAVAAESYRLTSEWNNADVKQTAR
jgi:hypothetical protein